MTAEALAKAIAATELHRDCREQNAMLRSRTLELLTRGITRDQIDAALVSDCRSDALNCGRCYLIGRLAQLTK